MSKLSTKLVQKQSEVRKAVIVSNYGDPGIDTNYMCDILSRFVVVMFEPSKVPCAKKGRELFGIALRPRHLWIDINGNVPMSGGNVDLSLLRRSDYYGRIAVGDTVTSQIGSSIPKIQPNYKFGETITVSRLSEPITLDDFEFTSAFSHTAYNANGKQYEPNGYYKEGLPDPNYVTSSTIEGKTRFKPVIPNTQYGVYVPNGAVTPNTDTNKFVFSVFKRQYELMVRYLNSDTQTVLDNSLLLFNNGAYVAKNQVDAKGGYLFRDIDRIDLTSIGWQEVSPTRHRLEAQECNPLIVTAPNTFPTPKSRAHGTIIYNPTYSIIN